MPRKPRVEYAGAIYHIMSKGDRSEAIARDDNDRKLFVKTLGDACARTGWIVHAYVLMDNHYHLLVETPEANLVAGMKWLQSTYTIRYNTRHREGGHLFQGRYKALIINPEENGYLRRVSTYIHLNPARAGKVAAGSGRLREYQWSSYPMFLNQKNNRPKWLQTNRVMNSLDIDPAASGARQQYFDYLEEYCRQLSTEQGNKELEAEWKDIRRGWCFGGVEFRDRMLARVEDVLQGHEQDSYSGEAVQAHGVMAAERKIKECLVVLKISEAQLNDMPKGHPIKRAITWAIRKQTTVSNRWLSKRLLLGHPANIPGYTRSIEQAVSGRLVRLRKQIEEILKSED